MKESCDYKAVRNRDLKRHISYLHEGIKPFKCNICDYENAQKKEFKETHRNCPFKNQAIQVSIIVRNTKNQFMKRKNLF